MARADLAKLIADHLDALPLPDGRTFRFMHYSSFGQSDDIKRKVADRALMVGTAIAHLIESHGGYTVSHPADPRAVDEPGRKVAKAFCAHCGSQLLNLAVDDNMECQLGVQAIRMIAQLNPDCPHT